MTDARRSGSEPIDPYRTQVDAPVEDPVVGAGADHRALETLFQASPDAVVVVGPEGAVAMANHAVEELFGWPPEDLVGRPVETLLPEELRDVHVGHRSGFERDPRPRPMGAGLQLLGRRRDGRTFPIDVALSPVLIGDRPLVAAFVRDATERRRGEALLEYVNDLDQHMLSDGDPEEAMSLVCHKARSLLEAAAAWVVTTRDADTLAVAAADGVGAELLGGTRYKASGSLSMQVMREGRPLLVNDMAGHPAVIAEARPLGFSSGMYLPLTAEGRTVGALVVTRTAGQPPFSAGDLALAEVFAASAAVSLSLGYARLELEDLRMTAEHERIARDLHDTVIQRLFALGMGLQGILRMSPPPVAERINQAVDTLDEVIREIRETIFDLQQPGGARSVKRQVRDVVAEAEEHLGFGPRLVFRGAVDSAVTDRVAVHLTAVVREALSNVARHAHASRVDVVIEAAGRQLALFVTDDGVGPPEGPGGGNGLGNMTSRAEELEGRLSIGPAPGGGTALEWRVPLD